MFLKVARIEGSTVVMPEGSITDIVKGDQHDPDVRRALAGFRGDPHPTWQPVPVAENPSDEDNLTVAFAGDEHVVTVFTSVPVDEGVRYRLGIPSVRRANGAIQVVFPLTDRHTLSGSKLTDPYDAIYNY